jgi:hypothetical protein
MCANGQVGGIESRIWCLTILLSPFASHDDRERRPIDERATHPLPSPPKVPGILRRTRFRLGAVLALAIAAAVVGWLAWRHWHPSFSLAPVDPVAAEVLSAGGLSVAAGQVGHPVYWAGTRTGYTYEFSRTREDSIFIRYLPTGTALGTRGRYLIVATYRLRDAYAAIQRASKGKHSVAVRIPNGGLAVYSPLRPTAYYFAYPGSHYQVGVFAPTALGARNLVLHGHVVPVR